MRTNKKQSMEEFLTGLHDYPYRQICIVERCANLRGNITSGKRSSGCRCIELSAHVSARHKNYRQSTLDL